MPCIETNPGNRTVEIEARLAIPPDLGEKNGNGCLVGRDIMPSLSRIKMVHDATNGNSVPIAALAFDLPNPML
jgi:hypothetical protein